MELFYNIFFIFHQIQIQIQVIFIHYKSRIATTIRGFWWIETIKNVG